MAKAEKKGFIRRYFKVFKLLFVLGLIAAVILGLYTYKMTRQAEYKFDRSHMWDLPSKIYSDADYYYPGLKINSNRLKEKLNRLGYRDAGAAIKGPGEYAFTPAGADIYLHDFSYPDEDFRGFPASIKVDEGVITSITAMEDGSALSTIKLEPELVAALFGSSMEDRTLVTMKDIPQHLLEAIVIIEDERFFKHSGVDLIAVTRAAFKDLLALGIVEGGSTLTQQLVKNYFLTDQRSFVRKFQEAIIALLLEREHTKSEILEAYVNEIYLGQRGNSSVSGIGEAAKLYFGKNVDQMTTGECALLAGMIKSPSTYNPFTNKESAKERRDFVLKRLFETKLITEAEYKEALAEQIITPQKATRTNKAPFFVDFVKTQLTKLYSEDILTKEGLKIFTTLDMTHQLIAERIVAEEITRLESENQKILPKDHEGQLQGALISIQPQTGYIRALIGGRDYTSTQFNHITQASRQPGSTFKPFVYLTAFDPERSDNLYAPSSLIDDTSFSTVAGGKDWSPLNYDKKEHGTVTLHQALVHSYNIATAKLAMNIGLENVVGTARDCGITSDMLAVPAMALGAFEVTPLELSAAYTVFPNNGIRAEPVSVINVVTKDGEMLDKKDMEMKRVFDPQPVYLVNFILKDVMISGTAASAKSYGWKGVSAGKTGTTSNYRDAWFAGFTPNYLALTWVGYDDNAEMNMSGGKAALPIWAKFMAAAIGDPQEDFTLPKGILLVKIDPTTGKLAGPKCPKTEYEPFIEGTEPNEVCERH